jgi:hypothetical protein
MYVILLLLIFILWFYGSPKIEGAGKKDKKSKSKGKGTVAPEGAAPEGGMGSPLCSENEENIKLIRSQVKEILSLKQQVDVLRKTKESNKNKLDKILQKVSTMV